jgi:hypothetical protein
MKNRKKLSVLFALIASVAMILLVMNISSYARTLNVMGQVEINPPCDNASTGTSMNEDPAQDSIYIMGSEVPKSKVPCQINVVKQPEMSKDPCTKTLDVMGHVVIKLCDANMILY